VHPTKDGPEGCPAGQSECVATWVAFPDVGPPRGCRQPTRPPSCAAIGDDVLAEVSGMLLPGLCNALMPDISERRLKGVPVGQSNG
jgi:hypothetical protein